MNQSWPTVSLSTKTCGHRKLGITNEITTSELLQNRSASDP